MKTGVTKGMAQDMGDAKTKSKRGMISTAKQLGLPWSFNHSSLLQVMAESSALNRVYSPQNCAILALTLGCSTPEVLGTTIFLTGTDAPNEITHRIGLESARGPGGAGRVLATDGRR